MSEENFTQEQVQEQLENAKNEWIEQELNPVVAERDELVQYKPVEKTEQEIEFEEKQQAFFQKQVDHELKAKGLDMFAEVIKVENEEELENVVKALDKIMNDIKVNHSYKPTDHSTDDEYSKFAKDKDTTGMIGSKLAGLFK